MFKFEKDRAINGLAKRKQRCQKNQTPYKSIKYILKRTEWELSSHISE